MAKSVGFLARGKGRCYTQTDRQTDRQKEGQKEHLHKTATIAKSCQKRASKKICRRTTTTTTQKKWQKYIKTIHIPLYTYAVFVKLHPIQSQEVEVKLKWQVNGEGNLTSTINWIKEAKLAYMEIQINLSFQD